MTYRPPQPDRRDIWGPLAFIALGLLIACSMGCCAVNERIQIEKDVDMVNAAMFKLQFDIKNPYDQNTVRNARQELKERMLNQQ